MPLDILGSCARISRLEELNVPLTRERSSGTHRWTIILRMFEPKGMTFVGDRWTTIEQRTARGMKKLSQMFFLLSISTLRTVATQRKRRESHLTSIPFFLRIGSRKNSPRSNRNSHASLDDRLDFQFMESLGEQSSIAGSSVVISDDRQDELLEESRALFDNRLKEHR